MTDLAHQVRRALVRASAGKSLSLDEVEALLTARGDALDELLGTASNLRDLGHGSALLVPVVAAGQTIGLLEGYSRTPRSWTRTEITRARTIAHIIGLAMRALQTP
jgi:GAF domain-containing protein